MECFKGILQMHESKGRGKKNKYYGTNLDLLCTVRHSLWRSHNGKDGWFTFLSPQDLLTFFFPCLSYALKWDLLSAGKWKRSDFHYCNYYRYASSIIQNWMNLHCMPKAESSSLAFLLPPLLNPNISDFSIFLDSQVPKRHFLSADQNLLCCAICQKRKLPFKSDRLKEKCGSSYSLGREPHSQIN